MLIEQILGGLAEANFVESMRLMHDDALGFFGRPVAATLIVLGVAAPMADD